MTKTKYLNSLPHRSRPRNWRHDSYKATRFRLDLLLSNQLQMSSLLNFGMHSSKKEKHYANSRARRHSDVVISHGSKKTKKEKDGDSE